MLKALRVAASNANQVSLFLLEAWGVSVYVDEMCARCLPPGMGVFLTHRYGSNPDVLGAPPPKPSHTTYPVAGIYGS